MCCERQTVSVRLHPPRLSKSCLSRRGLGLRAWKPWCVQRGDRATEVCSCAQPEPPARAAMSAGVSILPRVVSSCGRVARPLRVALAAPARVYSVCVCTHTHCLTVITLTHLQNAVQLPGGAAAGAALLNAGPAVFSSNVRACTFVRWS